MKGGGRNRTRRAIRGRNGGGGGRGSFQLCDKGISLFFFFVDTMHDLKKKKKLKKNSIFFFSFFFTSNFSRRESMYECNSEG